jgi:hypothetical protein
MPPVSRSVLIKSPQRRILQGVRKSIPSNDGEEILAPE